MDRNLGSTGPEYVYFLKCNGVYSLCLTTIQLIVMELRSWETHDGIKDLGDVEIGGPETTGSERAAMEEVIRRHQGAFALNSKFGPFDPRSKRGDIGWTRHAVRRRGRRVYRRLTRTAV